MTAEGLTLLWYDLETTGTSPNSDRIMQFAALRTDLSMQVCGEPINIYCQPSYDSIPDPEACLITGLSPQMMKKKGLPEYRFAAEVCGHLEQPGTCTTGYNTIHFDDEFVRYLLFRNFYDPYAREWQNGNSRWDTIDLVRMCRALRPDGIEWPVNEEGNSVFGLQRLCEANGISYDNPHEALCDVQANIELLRLIHDRQPRLFKHALSMRSWRTAAELADPDRERAIVYTSRIFGPERHYSGVVLPLCEDPQRSKKIIAADLSADPELLLSAEVEQLTEVLSSTRNTFNSGLVMIHLNRSPMVAPLATVDEAAQARLNVDLSSCQRNLEKLQSDPGLSHKLRQALEAAPAFEPMQDPDRALYNHLLSDSDRQKQFEIRSASPDQLATTSITFEDPLLNQLLFRYRARNFPQTLSAAEREDWEQWRYRRITDPDPQYAGYRNLEWYQEKIGLLSEKLVNDSASQTLLKQLEDWTDELLA